MDRIADLARQVEAAATAYYSSGSSSLTDAEYDALADELRSLDPDNAALSVGYELEDTPWEKVTLEFPMGSQNKCKTFDEFSSWAKDRTEILMQEKLDGISVALTYESGKLTLATTRGTGTIGEDITRNVRKMQGVPVCIKGAPEHLVVRGEIVFRHSDFEKIQGVEFKNPRNAASGVAKRLSGRYCELLTVICYDVTHHSDCEFKTELEKISVLRNFQFNIACYKTVDTLDEARAIYEAYIAYARAKLDHDIDGLVAKTNLIAPDNWEFPKHQIAWKFPSQSAPSVIKEITYYVRGDHVTPVAIVEPVDICGVTIRRASLHNVGLAAKKGIGPGAKVEVTRRNDVIPHIESVLVPGAPLTIPEACPICGGEVEFEKNAAGGDLPLLVCTSEACPQKRLRRMNGWLGIHERKGIGSAALETLMESGIATNLKEMLLIPDRPDIKDEIIALPGLGYSKYRTLCREVAATLKTDLIKFLAVFKIRQASTSTLEKILAHLDGEVDLQRFISFIESGEFAASSIPGIGDSTKTLVRLDLAKKKDLILDVGRVVEIDPFGKEAVETTGDLAGLTFCFTGALNSMKRRDADKLVKSMGGGTKSVSKGLNYLVCNDVNSTSGKMKKARALGTKIITEAEFLKMVGKSVDQPESDPSGIDAL